MRNEEGEDAPSFRSIIHKEHLLQVQVNRMVTALIDQPAISFRFRSYNRSGTDGRYSHSREAAAGMCPGELDTAIIGAICGAPWSGDPRIELKAPGVQFYRRDGAPRKGYEAQHAEIMWLRSIGRYASWANSCVMYLERMREAGIALRPGSDVAASQYDARVAAAIASAEARRDGKKIIQARKALPRFIAKKQFVTRMRTKERII